MDTELLVQPEQQIEELAGDLQVPDLPIISAGYADIYHGVWTRPDGVQVEVAVKELKILIPRNRQSDPKALQRRTDIRMKREVLAWSQTTHPNLHPLLGYRSKPRPRLISPWCRHGNLTDYMLKNPGLSKLDKLRFIHQTGRALFHLHSQAHPICHADIKPENVLINDCCDASLSDFGLSRVLHEFDGPSGLTTSETVKGTLNYMAGELFIGENARPGRETDVYAFRGLILTVMSGNAPYFKLRGANIMLQAMQYWPPKPEDHPNLPPSDPLWSLIRRCWSKTPSARPTMREVLGELDGYTYVIRSSSELIPRAPSVVQTDVGEGFSLNLHTQNAPSQGEFLALLSPSPVPVDEASVANLISALHDLGEFFQSDESPNLHTPNAPSQGQFLALLSPKPAPVDEASVANLISTLHHLGEFFQSDEPSRPGLSAEERVALILNRSLGRAAGFEENTGQEVAFPDWQVSSIGIPGAHGPFAQIFSYPQNTMDHLVMSLGADSDHSESLRDEGTVAAPRTSPPHPYNSSNEENGAFPPEEGGSTKRRKSLRNLLGSKLSRKNGRPERRRP
ncbi:hypothetical protein FRC04_010420 [Tulasnella sp. 424]|nr:hypothetical protein FRC04_010420 [Tulasnella sp. 424]KAG8978647.1 hypothetical protein FRC05_009919 [Tulasnella sp. 425]